MEEKQLEYLKGLNEMQKKAVLHTNGPLLIVAGAGAGKTKTITHRILHLTETGISPEKILAITFTNKAGSEMRERARKLLAEKATVPAGFRSEPFISTFHSLGVYLIREFKEILDLPRSFTIFDKSDSLKAIKEATESAGFDTKMVEPRKTMAIISREKAEGRDAQDFENRELNFLEEATLKIWKEYDYILKKEKALDFDDLLLKTLFLLRKEEVQNFCHTKWSHIHIDEYQDTNKVQYEIAKILAGKEKNIAVVGDMDQSIYSWRGADFKNLLRFETDYPDAEVILLEENYRSTKNILAVANDIIAKNRERKEKNLYTKNPDGDLLSVALAYDEKGEADYIARTVRMLIRQDVPPDEIAVLYRANFQSRALEEACLSSEIPYELIGTKFFERKEVKDVLAYIKYALNRESVSELKRAISFPGRGIGKVGLLKILEGKSELLPKSQKQSFDSFVRLLDEIKEKAENDTVSNLIKYTIERSGIENALREGGEEDLERLENVRELVSIASSFDNFAKEEALLRFLDHTALASDQDEIKENTKKIRLMTIHAAKGLEFDYVFITGLEKNLFPHKRLDEEVVTTGEEEEERRLFYVALTRARKKIYLTHTMTRKIFGSTEYNEPSEFLRDIDNGFLTSDGDSGREKIIYLD